MNFDTNRISKMIKESSNGAGSRSNVNIVESRKVGKRTFGLIKEYGNYVIKYTNKPENVIEEDFKYIKGEQNRHRFMRSNLKEAQNFFNLFVSEQHINPFISEDDDKYVIKKEVEDQPEAEPDIDMDVDSADVDMDVEDETADEIEADLEEYQELTGKLAYILGQVEDDQKDDVTKYIFNSLIAAMPSVGDEVSSSIKQKLEDKLEGSEDEGGEEAETEMEESLKKKGFVVKESMSKQEALAFLGAADKSGIFKEKPTRFYDGETKEPHMNKGVHKKGKSTPYGEKKDKKDKNKPFTEKAKKKVNEEKTVKRKARIKVPTSASGYSISDIGKMQDAGEHDRVANLIINGALKTQTKGFMPDQIVNSNDFLALKLLLRSMSKRGVPVFKIYKDALIKIKTIITSKGYKVMREEDQMNELWQDVDENREKFNIGGELNPELEGREEEKRDAFRGLKKSPEHEKNVEANDYFMKTGRWPWQEKDEGEADYEPSLRQRDQEMSIEDMLSDEFLRDDSEY